MQARTPRNTLSAALGAALRATPSAAAVLAACLALGGPLAAQQLPFRSYERSDGLASDYVTCMAQDPAGFIWFGSDRGLSRYDGSVFEHYTVADGLPDAFILCLYPAPDGSLWAGTYRGGAVRVKGGEITVYDTSDGLPSNFVRSIARSGSGTMVFGTDRGPAWIAGGVVEAIPEPPGSGFVADLRDGSVLHLGDGRLSLLHPGRSGDDRLEPVAVEDTAWLRGINASTSAAFHASNGDLYITFNEGLFRCAGFPAGGPVRFDSLSWYRLTSIVEDRTGTLWGSTDYRGIFKIGRRDSSWIGVPEGLPKRWVETIMFDYEGNLWVSIFGSGVWKLAPGTVRRWTKAGGLPDDRVESVLLEGDGSVWIGTQRGLAMIEADRLRPAVNDSNKLDNVRAIHRTPAGRYYVGTFRYFVGPTSAADLIGWNDPPHQGVGYGIAGFADVGPEYGSPDFEILAGTFGGGVILGGPRGYVTGAPHGGLPGLLVEEVHRGTTGSWLLTRGDGAFRIRPDGVTRFGREQGLPSNAVYAVHEIADSRPGAERAWFATERAVIFYDRGRAAVLDESAGLRGGPAAGIFPVPPSVSGGASPEEAIVVTRRAVYRARPGGLEPILRLSFLSETGAALNRAFHLPGDSLVWLATSRGLFSVAIRPASAPPPPPPRIAITTVLAGGSPEARESLPWSGPDALVLDDLAPDLNDVTIGYAGLSFESEEEVQYRTMLLPADSVYSEPGATRTGQFRNLSEGEYEFRALALNASGIPSAGPAVVRFRILPPYWKRWWFLGGAGLLVVGSALAIGRSVTARKYRERLRELERLRAVQEERERISRDLHDHVGGQLAGIITGLELAGRYEDAKGPERRELLDALRDDARRSMDQLRETIWALQSSSFTLPMFCAEVRSYGARYFRYRPEIDFTAECTGGETMTLHPHEVLELFRVVQEALANILRHARPTRAAIRFAGDAGGRLSISVLNDGAGDPSSPTDSLSPADPSSPADSSRSSGPLAGLGLRNMTRRMESLGGRLSWERTPAGEFRLTAVCRIRPGGPAA